MTTTPEIKAEILRAYNANPSRFSPFKTAKLVGVSMATVLEVVDDHRQNNEGVSGKTRSAGRDDLLPYVVASRRANAPGWDNNEPAVANARQQFAAGTHTMATHRDGGWLHLCLFPLKRPIAPRLNYFIPGSV
jgi:hypothetical protein